MWGNERFAPDPRCIDTPPHMQQLGDTSSDVAKNVSDKPNMERFNPIRRSEHVKAYANAYSLRAVDASLCDCISISMIALCK